MGFLSLIDGLLERQRTIWKLRDEVAAAHLARMRAERKVVTLKKEIVRLNDLVEKLRSERGNEVKAWPSSGSALTVKGGGQ